MRQNNHQIQGKNEIAAILGANIITRTDLHFLSFLWITFIHSVDLQIFFQKKKKIQSCIHNTGHSIKRPNNTGDPMQAINVPA